MASGLSGLCAFWVSHLLSRQRPEAEAVLLSTTEGHLEPSQSLARASGSDGESGSVIA
jgi:hypothetical protein